MFQLPNAQGGEFPRERPEHQLEETSDQNPTLTDSGSYTEVAKGPEAHAATLKAASAIAVVGARVIVDDEFAKQTTEAWKKQMQDIRAEETVVEINKLLAPFDRMSGGA